MTARGRWRWGECTRIHAGLVVETHVEGAAVVLVQARHVERRCVVGACLAVRHLLVQLHEQRPRHALTPPPPLVTLAATVCHAALGRRPVADRRGPGRSWRTVHLRGLCDSTCERERVARLLAVEGEVAILTRAAEQPRAAEQLPPHL